MKIVFFPGKNSPVKTYRSYFPTLELVSPDEVENPEKVLCHSLGLKNAVEYYRGKGEKLTIISIWCENRWNSRWNTSDQFLSI